jgi:hypothetical protein
MELERDLSLQNMAEEDLSLFTEPVRAYHPLRIAMCLYTRSHANSIFDSRMTRLPSDRFARKAHQSRCAHRLLS